MRILAAILVAALVGVALLFVELPPSVTGTSEGAAAMPAGLTGPDGVYVMSGCEGEGGCPNRNWRTKKPTQLLASQSTSAQVLATLLPQEWVVVETVETRLFPSKGVVKKAGQGLKTGDVIYDIGYLGEGVVSIWHNGQMTSLEPTYNAETDPVVEWDKKAPPAAIAPTLGLWARVKRENGQTGWVHDPEFECMGQLAGDADCRD